MNTAPLLIDQAEGLTTLSLHNPGRRNAISLAGWTALRQAIMAVDDDPDCRVVVLRGSDGHFGAGADIGEFPTAFATEASTLAYFGEMEGAMRAIEHSAKPVIAAIDGLCIGACVALALACDIRIAADASSFAVTPAKIGIAYPYGDIQRLVRAIGPGAARSLLFTGDRLPAPEAARIGLIDHLAPAEAFEVEVDLLARRIAANSHFTVRSSKTAVKAILDGTDRDGTEYRKLLVAAVMGPDFAEGIAAFGERRAPRFPATTPPS